MSECNLVRSALKFAQRSTFWRARMSALVVSKKRILSIGINDVRYCKDLRRRKHERSFHAEQSAIVQMIKAGRMKELKGSTIIVSRIGKSNNQLMAKPCECCHELICFVQIRKVIYTTAEGVEEYVIKSRS